MGTTLTGTTPQDTYDSLIKVTDNGPLSGSLKKLTDGLGNDSSLSLSTTAASLSGTLAVTGASTFSSAITAATGSNFTGTAVNSKVLVTAAGVANTVLGFNNSGSTESGVVNNAGYLAILQDYPFVVAIADAEKMRITGTGNVGIGTSSPAALIHGSQAAGNAPELRLTSATVYAKLIADDTVGGTAILDGAYAIKLLVDGSERARVTTNGLTFNGDTAAANALDDYEEGTFTPVYAGGLTSVTYTNTSGRYTKIGNRVMFDIRIQASAVGGASGALLVGGLPFATSSQIISNATIGFFGVYTTDIVYALMDTNTINSIYFYKKDGTTLLGSELTNDTSAIHMSGIYFV